MQVKVILEMHRPFILQVIILATDKLIATGNGLNPPYSEGINSCRGRKKLHWNTRLVGGFALQKLWTVKRCKVNEKCLPVSVWRMQISRRIWTVWREDDLSFIKENGAHCQQFMMRPGEEPGLKRWKEKGKKVLLKMSRLISSHYIWCYDPFWW